MDAEQEPQRVEVDGMELHVDPIPSDTDEQSGPHTALPPRVEAWRRRSVTGAILTGFAFGLKDALEPEREEPGIIQQVSGQPVGDLPVEAHVDDFRPAESVVMIRPWLFDNEPPLEDGPST